MVKKDIVANFRDLYPLKSTTFSNAIYGLTAIGSSWKRFAGDAIPVRIQAVGILFRSPCRFIKCLRFLLGVKVRTVSIRAFGIIGDMIGSSVTHHGVHRLLRAFIPLAPLFRFVPIPRNIPGAFPNPQPPLPRKFLRFLEGFEVTAGVV